MDFGRKAQEQHGDITHWRFIVPAPINSETICQLTPSSTASVCDRVKAALIEIPTRLCEFFAWMLDGSGNLSTEFKAAVAASTWSPGDYKYSATAVQPDGWSLCDGGLLSRSDYSLLFDKIGTIYGAGDGVTTFNKPDWRGRGLIGAGQGSGLSARLIGQSVGEESHALTEGELTSHSHLIPMPVSEQASDNLARVGAAPPPAAALYGSEDYAGNGRVQDDSGQNWNDRWLPYSEPVGSDTPHNNMQPSGVAYVFIFTGRFV